MFSLIALTLIVSLRGSFGSDTLSLYYQLDSILTYGTSYLYQPLWLYYNKLTGFLGATNSLGYFNLINALFIVPLFYFATRDSSQLNAIKILFVPIIFIDLTTNTQRLGLFLLLFLILSRFGSGTLSPSKYLLAGGHFSLLILTIFDKKIARNLLAISIISALLFLYFGETIIELLNHISIYEDLEDRGSEFRGLSDIVLMFIILNWSLFKLKLNIRFLVIALATTGILFYLAGINYGVVRTIKLILYWLILNDTNFSINNLGKHGFILSIILLSPISLYMFSMMMIGFGTYAGE